MAYPRKNSAPVGVKAPFPGFINPALATSVETVPGGERWVHEIKFDGHRAQIYIVNEAVKVLTRRGNDWTNRFRKIANDAWHISARSAIIDGEVVGLRGRDHGFLGPSKRVERQVVQNNICGV